MHTSLAQSRFCFQQKKNKYQTITPESSQDPPVEANSITTFCSLLLNTYTAHLYRSHQAQFALCVYTSRLYFFHCIHSQKLFPCCLSVQNVVYQRSMSGIQWEKGKFFFFFFFHILSLDLFIVLLAKLPCRLETTSLTIFQGISGNS